jgi:hypothetical protein
LSYSLLNGGSARRSSAAQIPTKSNYRRSGPVRSSRASPRSRLRAGGPSLDSGSPGLRSSPAPSAIHSAARGRSSRSRASADALARRRRSISVRGTTRRTTRNGTPSDALRASTSARSREARASTNSRTPAGPEVGGQRLNVLLQHQRLGVTASGVEPHQVVQVHQREGRAALLQQVGDLLGHRALARPEHARDQYRPFVARLHGCQP